MDRPESFLRGTIPWIPNIFGRLDLICERP
jgi:hypothetical protein